MILYHGSTEIVDKPKILIAEHYLDFGYGFYTTTSREQASRWAEIKKKRTNSENSFLNIYEIDDSVFLDNSFTMLNFDNPSHEWLEFVIGNRNGKAMHNYDFVQGPVADDRLYQTFTMYETGILTSEETIRRLKINKLYDQLSFHTEKALKKLIFREIITTSCKFTPD